MGKKFRMAAISVLLILALFQSGCWDQKHYEDIGFVLQMGMEIEDGDKMLFSITTPVISPEAKEKVELLQTSNQKLIRSSREEIRNVSGKLLQGGKIQLVYFSKELAQQGINNYLEIFLRDPENPLLSNLVVVDKSPKEMIEKSLKFKTKPRSAIYAAELIQDARRRLVVPETRIFNFSILYNSKTIDPVTPIFKYDDKNIIVAGTALFNRDKMVGEINTDETKLFNVLIGSKESFEYIYREEIKGSDKDDLEKGAAIFLKSAKRKIKIDTSSKKPVIKIDLKFKASLDEYTGKEDLDSLDNQEKLEKLISQALHKDIIKVVKKLQELGTDPIGFGEMVRAKQNSYWKKNNWKDEYKNAEIRLKVDTDLTTYGTIR